MACTPELLKTVPLFALLDEQEAAVLAREVEVKTFAARQRIYKMVRPERSGLCNGVRFGAHHHGG